MMSQTPRANSQATVSQLKADIDAGRTGDKVANPDPGLSPLGTDDEAAGNPVTPKRAAMARAQETHRNFDQSSDPGKTFSAWLLPVVIAVIVVLVVAFLFWRHQA